MSKLEQKLLFQIRAMGLPEPEREYRAIKGRMFRFDFAWEKERLLVEVNGGNWVRGRHARPLGLKNDYEKLNLAMLAGWRVMQFDGTMIENGEALDMIAKALEG
jgi:very-short-patch-repair endonuclease